LFQTLRCEEALSFAAQLKLGLKGDELEEKVNITLESLGLLKCRKTLIGSQHIKGLSGGERKRTAIGVELINNPSIIFLDEPTSGLDSFTANKIVKLLVDQAKLGKTVVATIHQPSSSTYGLFDRLLLLMDGHTIYQGPAQDASDYFTSIGYQCPQFTNPADYFLKEFYIPFKRTSDDDKKLELVVSGYNDKIRQKVTEEDEAIKLTTITKETLAAQSHHVGTCKEICLLLSRTGKNLIRNPQASRVRIIQAIIMSILIILVFWDMGTSSEDVNGKGGYCFFISINQIMTALFSVLLTFLSERPVFLREYANKMYGIMPYFLSKSIIEIPFQACIPFMVACITYFSVGLTADADRFFLHALVLILDVFCATSFGFFVGCAVTNESAANALVSLMMLPFILFAGYFVNLGDVYVWLRWIQYLSPVRYSTEALIRIEFEDNDRYNVSEPLYERFDYDVGLTNCIIILAVLSIFFR
jgi:ABC-type multidrug transport system ATPase subunit